MTALEKSNRLLWVELRRSRSQLEYPARPVATVARPKVDVPGAEY